MAQNQKKRKNDDFLQLRKLKTKKNTIKNTLFLSSEQHQYIQHYIPRYYALVQQKYQNYQSNQQLIEKNSQVAPKESQIERLNSTKLSSKLSNQIRTKKVCFYKRLKKLPQNALSDLMQLLSATGRFSGNKIELDFDKYDQATLQQIQQFIKLVEKKYKFN